jgi:putative tricarboxylic transport membrane protein
VTALDGHRMARQGKAGLALATAAIGSFIAGTAATVLVALFAPPLAEVALQFGPAEYFSLMVLGLVASIVLASGSLLHALAVVVVGLVLGLVGTDVNSGVSRYSLGFPQLGDGIGFVVIAMGMFGLAEIVSNLEHEGTRGAAITRVKGLLPSREDWGKIIGPISRGTVLGSALGILPGGGAILASFASYSLEKKLSQTPEEFGQGAIEGVAGPEAANNAGAQTSFIPMLTLGIPANPVMALMIGALMIQGIQPGPTIITEQATLFWGVVVSMWIGNVFLLILNLPLIGLWVRMISVPYHLLYPAIMVFCAIGVFSISNTTFDVYLMALFGLLGYLFMKLGCEPTPLLLGFILGPPMEEHLRRAMVLSEGRVDVLLREPLSAFLLAIAALLLASVLLPTVRKGREETFVSES